MGFKSYLPTAVYAKRIHHQLLPTVLELENGYPVNIASELEKEGHKISWMSYMPSYVHAILQEDNGKLNAVSDPRWDHVCTCGLLI